jgi:hypothetical protein
VLQTFEPPASVLFAQTPGGSLRRPRQTLLATGFLVTSSLHIPTLGLVPLAPFFGILLLFASRRELRQYARNFAPLIWFTVVTGLVLLIFVTPDVGAWSGPTTAVQLLIYLSSIYIYAFGGAYSLLLVGLRRGLVLAGLASAVGNALYLNGNITSALVGHPDLLVRWKYVVGFGLSLAALAMMRSFKRQVAIAALLMLVFVTAQARSMTTALTVAVILGFVQLLPSRRSALQRIVLSGLLVVSVLLCMTQAMKHGLLGQHLQISYATETQRGHGLLLGGRSELAASRTLFVHRPVGYGLGVVPSDALVGEAVSSVADLGADTPATYYLEEVFGRRVDLHSFSATLWYHTGPTGIALAAYLLLLLARGSLAALKSRRGPDVPVVACQFALWSALWDVLFSPLAQIDRIGMGLAVALLLVSAKVTHDSQ